MSFGTEGKERAMDIEDLMIWKPCYDCQGMMTYVSCDTCEAGAIPHDCGDDTCCCLDPRDEDCEQCDGEGYWYYCATCEAR